MLLAPLFSPPLVVFWQESVTMDADGRYPWRLMPTVPPRFSALFEAQIHIKTCRQWSRCAEKLFTILAGYVTFLAGYVTLLADCVTILAGYVTFASEFWKKLVILLRVGAPKSLGLLGLTNILFGLHYPLFRVLFE